MTLSMKDKKIYSTSNANTVNTKISVSWSSRPADRRSKKVYKYVTPKSKADGMHG